jgi:hypothetical protein
MDSEATADVVREVDRQADEMAGRPRQNVYDDVVRQAVNVPGARAERSIETPVAPPGGPEYTGRA